MELVVLASLAMASVCLWTLRVASTTRGYRLLAPPLAAVEALVYVTAFVRLLADVGSTERKLAFGLGVAAGTYVAMLVADRVRPDARPRRTASAPALADRFTCATHARVPDRSRWHGGARTRTVDDPRRPETQARPCPRTSVPTMPSPPGRRR